MASIHDYKGSVGFARMEAETDSMLDMLKKRECTTPEEKVQVEQQIQVFEKQRETIRAERERVEGFKFPEEELHQHFDKFVGACNSLAEALPDMKAEAVKHEHAVAKAVFWYLKDKEHEERYSSRPVNRYGQLSMGAQLVILEAMRDPEPAKEKSAQKWFSVGAAEPVDEERLKTLRDKLSRFPGGEKLVRVLDAHFKPSDGDTKNQQDDDDQENSSPKLGS